MAACTVGSGTPLVAVRLGVGAPDRRPRIREIGVAQRRGDSDQGQVAAGMAVAVGSATSRG
jgi:hypothetical protein